MGRGTADASASWSRRRLHRLDVSRQHFPDLDSEGDPGMSEATISTTDPRTGRPLGATVWFCWMTIMWVAFFVLLVEDRLDGLWAWIRDLPLLVEAVLWVALLPWVLGTAVWTSSWPDTVRMPLVGLFALGWTIISIPRQKTVAGDVSNDPHRM
jgi:hypothetical protein